MKILVTGSNGQVGRSIKQLSMSRNESFIFTDRTSLDITGEVEVKKFIELHQPNIIINTAAYTAVDNAESDEKQCFAVNEIAVKSLAKALHLSKTKNKLFIHISSDYVYHPKHDKPMKEEHKTNPQSVYANSKLAGDQAALEHFDNSVILRTSWVYAKEGNNFVNTMKRLCSERSKLNIVADQIGSPTYAPDIANCIFEIIDKYLQNPQTKISGVYNFSNDGFISWHKFAYEINNLIKADCELTPIPTSQYPTPAKRPLNSRMDKTKIQQAFDINLIDWTDSLRKCLID